jgi:F-type H+-transporting ATPase subunit c
MPKNTLTNHIIDDEAIGRPERMRKEAGAGQSRWKGGGMKRLLALLVSAFALMSVTGMAFAADAATAGADSQARVAIAFSAGIAVAIAAFGAALGQGRVGAAAMESIGRNPNAADRLFLPLVLTLALLEALALYGFVIAILLQGKI